MSTYPRSFSHIGISVPDLEAAVKFYTEVLGWYLIMPPTDIVEDDSAIGEMCTDVFGQGWERFRIAHLSTGDRIGVELFEFKNHKILRTILNIGKPGFSISVCKILMSKGSRRKSSPQVAKSVCQRHVSTFPVKNRTA